MRYVLMVFIGLLPCVGLSQVQRFILPQAEEMLEKNDTSVAISLFEKALHYDPQNFQAALRLANIYYDQKQWPNAANYTNIGLSILSDTRQELIEQHFYEADSIDTTEINNAYQKHKVLKQHLASLYHLRGKIRMKQGNFYSAESDLQNAYESDPDNPDILLDLGLVANYSNQLKSAFDYMFRAFELKSDHYLVLFNLANLFLQVDDSCAYISFLNKSTQANPQFGEGLLHQARWYMNQNEYDQAIGSYTSYLKLDSAHIESLFRRGYAYQQIGYERQAIADWEMVYQLDPDQIEALRNAALTKMRQQNYNEAIQDFSNLILREPQETLHHLNRGYSYMLNQNYSKALDDFQWIIERNAQNNQAFYYMSLTYALMNKPKKACRNYQKALNLGYTRADTDKIIRELCN
ncbi:MAG: tetratricopeptide repeat protein [Candidatus Cyclobacteriaceae bacterium M3_2C_046]